MFVDERQWSLHRRPRRGDMHLRRFPKARLQMQTSIRGRVFGHGHDHARRRRFYHRYRDSRDKGDEEGHLQTGLAKLQYCQTNEKHFFPDCLAIFARASRPRRRLAVSTLHNPLETPCSLRVQGLFHRLATPVHVRSFRREGSRNIADVPHFDGISNYLENPKLTPILNASSRKAASRWRRLNRILRLIHRASQRRELDGSMINTSR